MTSVDLQPSAAESAAARPAVAVVDLGSGNIGSILNMFRRAGVVATIASTVEEVRSAPRLVLPGVGAFDAVMGKLNASGLIGSLEERVLGAQIPFLGICVGLQVLARGSEEGSMPGLGWLAAEVRRLPAEHDGELLRIPHMGWARTTLRKPPLALPSLQTSNRFYFVHSYSMVCDRPEDVLAVAHYGAPLVAAVEVDNITAVQFHPEKSHRHGLAVLRDFAQADSR